MFKDVLHFLEHQMGNKCFKICWMMLEIIQDDYVSTMAADALPHYITTLSVTMGVLNLLNPLSPRQNVWYNYTPKCSPIFFTAAVTLTPRGDPFHSTGQPWSTCSSGRHVMKLPEPSEVGLYLDLLWRSWFIIEVGSCIHMFTLRNVVLMLDM